MRKLAEHGWSWDAELALQQLEKLTEEHEINLLRRLDRYPEMVANAAQNAEPYAVAGYLRELAAEFHAYYNAHKMLVDDPAIRAARVALSEAVRQVLSNGLSLLGVSAPESM
jgi:arginyl-tRNA synthetase